MGDRFIPNRASMDMDYAFSVMTHKHRPNSNPNPNPYYQALLSAALHKKHGSRIFAFRNHHPHNPNPKPKLEDTLFLPPSLLTRRFPSKPELILDAPGILCDNSFNVMDWGRGHVIAVALSETLYGYNLESKESFVIASAEEEWEEESGVVITGVDWNPDGYRIAVGLSTGEVQVWDVSAQRKLATFLGECGRGHVGSLAWNESHNLTFASGDGKILDWNLGSNKIVARYGGHRGKVLGLKWSPGRWLASSGVDMDVNIWDKAKPLTNFCKFTEHRAPARGLDWSPVRRDLLVSGGLDGLIKFWSISSAKCLRSVNAGSEVLGVLWRTNGQSELLSSHGSPGNHVALWRYPSMGIITNEFKHQPVQYMVCSPDGSKVACAMGESAPGAEDEKLMVWNFNDRPRVEKHDFFFSKFSSSSLRLETWKLVFHSTRRVQK